MSKDFACVDPALGPLVEGYVCVLEDDGLLACEGDEAADFLNRQLTQEVLHLSENEVRLAGYCSAKGRLLADVLIWRFQERLYLNCAAGLQEGLQKRLSMFILRAKVKLVDARAAYFQLALGGQKAGAVLQKSLGVLPQQVGEKVDFAQGCVMRLADAGQGLGARYLLLAARSAQAALMQIFSAELSQVPSAFARLAAIHAGVARITPATCELFVPQMLNFEAIGAIHFKKGCYPGQEIVARSQYLGKVKRRTYPAHVDAQASPGMDVFSPDDPLQACGVVVNAAPHPAGGSDCLVQIKLDAHERGEVRLSTAQGMRLHFLPLPYVLPT